MPNQTRSKSDYRIDQIGITLEALSDGFMTLQEYSSLVAAGVLTRKPQHVNDMPFQIQHPTHPLALRNRLARIKAAHAVMRLAKTHGEPFPREVLERVHDGLFDCCPTVRQCLAAALFYAGNQSSVAPLRLLVAQEQESGLIDTSPEVRRCAVAALGRCEAYGWYHDIPEGKPCVLLLARQLELACMLQEVAERRGAHLHQSHFPTDLLAIVSAAQVVDRRLCGYLWEQILDNMREAANEGLEDNTPLILVDVDPRAAACSQASGLPKPPGTVHYVSEKCPEEIASLLDHLLAV